MKTIKEWLEELPEPYRSQALENAEKEKSLEGLEPSLGQALLAGFRWSNTNQGHAYWGELRAELVQKESQSEDEMKLLVIGHAQHGKDTAAEMLYDMFGLTFAGSSQVANELFIFDALKEKYGYKTPEECFADRINHRAEWYDMICGYNKEDPARLAKEILNRANIYVGMRDLEEYHASRGLFDFVVGIYNPSKDLEPASSFNINIWTADFIVPNSSTKQELRSKLFKLFRELMFTRKPIQRVL